MDVDVNDHGRGAEIDEIDGEHVTVNITSIESVQNDCTSLPLMIVMVETSPSAIAVSPKL